MQFTETMEVAFDAMRANKMRSFLTMLGIVIGVGAVIAMVALGRGAQQSVKDRISALGTTLLNVVPGRAFGMGGVAAAGSRAPLTLDDADALRERTQYLVAVQPEMSQSLQVQYESENTSTTITGTTPNYLEVRKFEVQYGAMFTSADDAARRRVCLLGAEVVNDLGLRSPETFVGESVRIGGQPFQVVGILKAKGAAGGFGDPDDQVLIPIQTARYRLIGTDRLRTIAVLAASENDIPLAMAEIEKVLRRQHKLRSEVESDFSIRSQADFLNTLGQTTQVFTMLLAGIAAVSLLVGGIGIMNIMLVSVTERTREIGIRKALGATRFDVLMQFLIEAVVLCLIGGLIGIAFGAGTAMLLRTLFRWNATVDPASIAMAFVFAAAVGIVFGVWPARRAASLDPIEALRYE